MRALVGTTTSYCCEIWMPSPCRSRSSRSERERDREKEVGEVGRSIAVRALGDGVFGISHMEEYTSQCMSAVSCIHHTSRSPQFFWLLLRPLFLTAPHFRMCAVLVLPSLTFPFIWPLTYSPIVLLPCLSILSQDADVPIIWRPLHEAAGGWFWWGKKGAEPARRLWALMWDRFTNYHQVSSA